MGAHVTTPAKPSRIAERIGPVFSLDDVTTHLEGGPWSREEVTRQAKLRLLVAFRTDDEAWAFPVWGFDNRHGRLEVRSHVVDLWGRLPHASIWSDVDLSAWMNTNFRELRGTPASYVVEHEFDAIVAASVSRLRSRALG